MTSAVDDTVTERCVKRCNWRMLRRFRRSSDGSAAVEFTILALPFFMLIFATVESFVAFAGEQLLANAVDQMARQLRTGQITYNHNVATDKTEAQFRAAFCAKISIMMKCDSVADKDKSVLVLDVRNFTTFADIPKGIPRKGGSSSGDLDTSGFKYEPGGPKSINMVRAYYRWSVTTDVVRPYITNVKKNDASSPDYYLMIATAAFLNEGYP